MTTPDSRGLRNLSNEELEYLIGPPEQFRHEDATTLPRAFKRAIIDSGLDNKLASMGIMSSRDLPDDALGYVAAMPTGLTRVEFGTELSHQLAKMFVNAYTLDHLFEQRNDRWRKTPDRVAGYVPTDAGSLRRAMAHSVMVPTASLAGDVLKARSVEALATAYAYMGDPHFIPSPIAAEVVTATPPASSKRPGIRLPGQYAWVFHDGIPLTAIVGDSFPHDRSMRLVSSETLLLGAMLAGDDDLALHDLALLILASRRPDGRYAWKPLPLPMGTGAAATDIVWNYAGLLSWEDWKAPPRLPQRRRDESSRAYRRRISRTPEAGRGALHKVRVLDYQPPPATPRSKKQNAAASRELKYRQDRRGYWKHGIRFGIRDGNERLVGPVYKDGAIEGVTFTRRTKFIRPTVVREDLPRKPATTVYRLPDTVQRHDGGHQ